MGSREMKKHRASVLVLRYDNLRKQELRGRVAQVCEEFSTDLDKLSCLSVAELSSLPH